MQYYNNKVIWITGASSGFGESLVLALDKLGAKLILSSRSEDKLKKIAEGCKNAVVLPLDLAAFDTFPDKVNQAINLFGHIDIVIHNGAIAQRSAVVATPTPIARHIMDVDYFSYTELTQLILPHFIERKSGHFVVTSGLLAVINLPGRSTYAAAKAALIAYFHTLRAELLGDNINVTVIIPGAMKTAFAQSAIVKDASNSSENNVANGISTGEAAEQALAAIENKDIYEAFIGLKDDSYKLYQLTKHDANQGIATLLNKLKGL